MSWPSFWKYGPRIIIYLEQRFGKCTMYLSCKWMRTLWHCFTVHVAKIFACSKNLVQSSLLFTNHFLLNIWNCQQRVLLYIYLSVSSVWLSDSLSDIESSVSWYVSSSVCKVTDHQQPDKHYCSQNILRYHIGPIDISSSPFKWKENVLRTRTTESLE